MTPQNVVENVATAQPQRTLRDSFPDRPLAPHETERTGRERHTPRVSVCISSCLHHVFGLEEGERGENLYWGRMLEATGGGKAIAMPWIYRTIQLYMGKPSSVGEEKGRDTDSALTIVHLYLSPSPIVFLYHELMSCWAPILGDSI